MGSSEKTAYASVPVQFESGVYTVADASEANIHDGEIGPLGIRKFECLLG